MRSQENCQPEDCQSGGLSLEVGQCLACQTDEQTTEQRMGLRQVALVVALIVVISLEPFVAAARSVLEQSLALQGQPLPAGEP